MAKLSMTIEGDVTGLRSGSRKISLTAPSSNDAKFDSREYALANGNNTITVPTGAKACAIQPDSANAQTLTLKGNAADTGVPISKTLGTVLGLDGQASFIITTNGACTVEITFA